MCSSDLELHLADQAQQVRELHRDHPARFQQHGETGDEVVQVGDVRQHVVADEEVGGLADAMASDPGAMAKHYVPASPKVLHATPLVEPTRRAELTFTAPARPGRYPYLCTFPGHWRIMRGVLIVE